MKKEHKISLRIQIIATVAGGLILAGILYLLKLLSVIFSLASFLWSIITYSVSIQLWLLTILLLATIALAILLWNLRSMAKKKPDYLSYTEDTFFSTRWRWEYSGTKIINLWCFCPNCDIELVWRYNDIHDMSSYYCETHKINIFAERGDSGEVLEKVERQIYRRIRTGEWKNSIKQGA